MLRIAAALLIALAVGSAVSAAPAGRIAAALETSRSGVTAGRPWTAAISIRVGKRPYKGRTFILATGPLGRRTFTTRWIRPGHFRARIVFPAGGRWTLSVRAAGRTAPLASLEVRGAGPRISRPHGFEIAEEHGDLIVPDLDGTSFYEVLALPTWSETEIRSRVVVVNEEAVREAHAGPGAVVALPHSGNW